MSPGDQTSCEGITTPLAGDQTKALLTMNTFNVKQQLSP